MLYALLQLWMDDAGEFYVLYSLFQLWMDGVRNSLCSVCSNSAMDG